MADILDTGIKLVRNVGRYNIGRSALNELNKILESARDNGVLNGATDRVIFIVDHYFKPDQSLPNLLGCQLGDLIEFIPTDCEPTTSGVDLLVQNLVDRGLGLPAAVVGMGGGITMDYAKAVSNLLTNGGKAADYQGWDLVKNPGVFKVGIPTISGTGAEATRTCVMTNALTGLKLGMNSDFTVFDHVIMDPDLTVSVPRSQYFYTGMDSYIHCIESLSGKYRNSIGDAYSREVINLCRHVFLDDDMMSLENRERLMVASYLGGCAIATSYVGLIHPLSAALSVVLGVHHCIGNCIVMNAIDEFYPEAYDEFWRMADLQKVDVPKGICKDLTVDQLQSLYSAAIIHEKPLTNALGKNFRSILTEEKMIELFKKM